MDAEDRREKKNTFRRTVTRVVIALESINVLATSWETKTSKKTDVPIWKTAVYIQLITGRFIVIFKMIPQREISSVEPNTCPRIRSCH